MTHWLRRKRKQVESSSTVYSGSIHYVLYLYVSEEDSNALFIFIIIEKARWSL